MAVRSTYPRATLPLTYGPGVMCLITLLGCGEEVAICLSVPPVHSDGAFSRVDGRIVESRRLSLCPHSPRATEPTHHCLVFTIVF